MPVFPPPFEDNHWHALEEELIGLVTVNSTSGTSRMRLILATTTQSNPEVTKFLIQWSKNTGGSKVL